MTVGPPVASSDALLELCGVIARLLREDSARSAEKDALAESTSTRSDVARTAAGEFNRGGATRSRRGPRNVAALGHANSR